MLGKKGSKILKLPPVRNCFTLAMINKLVIIINILRVPKIKKILLYEMKFLVPNYSCLQIPWLGSYRPQIPVLSVLNWICWTPPPLNKVPGYATAHFKNRSAVRRFFRMKCCRKSYVASDCHWCEVDTCLSYNRPGCTRVHIRFSFLHHLLSVRLA